MAHKPYRDGQTCFWPHHMILQLNMPPWPLPNVSFPALRDRRRRAGAERAGPPPPGSGCRPPRRQAGVPDRSPLFVLGEVSAAPGGDLVARDWI